MYSPDKPFGTNGYRSNCMTLPFNQVLYTDHSTGVAVLFSYERQPLGHHALVLSGTRANGWISDKLPSTRPYRWQGFGIAKDSWAGGMYVFLASPSEPYSCVNLVFAGTSCLLAWTLGQV